MTIQCYAINASLGYLCIFVTFSDFSLKCSSPGLALGINIFVIRAHFPDGVPRIQAGIQKHHDFGGKFWYSSKQCYQISNKIWNNTSRRELWCNEQLITLIHLFCCNCFCMLWLSLFHFLLDTFWKFRKPSRRNGPFCSLAWKLGNLWHLPVKENGKSEAE